MQTAYRTSSWLRPFFKAVSCAAVVVACSPAQSPSDISSKQQKLHEQTASSTTAPTIIDKVGGYAAKIYRQRCVSCHGLAGHGNGVAARSLPVKPRSFRNAEWRASVSDQHLHTVIVRGGQAVGLSALMTANPDLKDRPDVVKGLIQIIRGL